MAKKNVRNMKVCGQNGYKYETIPEKSADDAGFFFHIERDSRKLQETMEKTGSYQCITYEDQNNCYN